MNQIIVSIVIPTFKRSDRLDNLLKSIEAQTFKCYEVIIVDDNSPNKDEYELVIDKYRNSFRKLTFLSNDTNMGAPYSRNRGIKIALSEFIALVDDDDEWLPEKLSKQIPLIVGDKNVGIVYTWTDALDRNRDIVYKYRAEISGCAKKEILKECFIPSPSVLVRKTSIENAGLFDLDFPSCQDWDMWTRMILYGYHCKVVKEVLTIYNKHGEDSIGVSYNAKKGYYLYYKRHMHLSLIGISLFLKRLYFIILYRLGYMI